ncbi:MAG: Hsp20/alpha crystallin family protein [Bulleidia sp.]
MRTDVQESDDTYTLKMDLPGFNRDDIQISLQNGNLSISAKREHSDEKKDDKGNVLRQERYYGTCSRTFYVGKDMEDSDIHASYNDGTLTLTVPKKTKKELKDTHYIEIG